NARGPAQNVAGRNAPGARAPKPRPPFPEPLSRPGCATSGPCLARALREPSPTSSPACSTVFPGRSPVRHPRLLKREELDTQAGLRPPSVFGFATAHVRVDAPEKLKTPALQISMKSGQSAHRKVRMDCGAFQD